MQLTAVDVCKSSSAHGWWDKTSVGERERPRWGSLFFFRAEREVDELPEELALRAGWRCSAAEEEALGQQDASEECVRVCECMGGWLGCWVCVCGRRERREQTDNNRAETPTKCVSS